MKSKIYTSSVPQVVGITISKKGMELMVKNIYIGNQINQYFNFHWLADEDYNIVKIDKNNVDNIEIPYDGKSLTLEDILDNGFKINLVVINNLKTNESSLPEDVVKVIGAYNARMNVNQVLIERSEGIDFS